MKIEFEHEYLRELYGKAQGIGQKYRFQPQVIKQYIKTVDILKENLIQSHYINTKASIMKRRKAICKTSKLYM